MDILRKSKSEIPYSVGVCGCVLWEMKLYQINLGVHPGHERTILCKCGYFVIVQGNLRILQSVLESDSSTLTYYVT